MTALAQARAEQARFAAWLREHPDWRDSAEMVDILGYGRMMKRSAYAGFMAGVCDWLMEECLILQEERMEHDTREVRA
jgi:hypothetical protein